MGTEPLFFPTGNAAIEPGSPYDAPYGGAAPLYAPAGDDPPTRHDSRWYSPGGHAPPASDAGPDAPGAAGE